MFVSVVHDEVDVTEPGYGPHPMIFDPYDDTDVKQRSLRFADVKDLSFKFDPQFVSFADGTHQKL